MQKISCDHYTSLKIRYFLQRKWASKYLRSRISQRLKGNKYEWTYQRNIYHRHKGRSLMKIPHKAVTPLKFSCRLLYSSGSALQPSPSQMHPPKCFPCTPKCTKSAAPALSFLILFLLSFFIHAVSQLWFVVLQFLDEFPFICLRTNNWVIPSQFPN